MSDRVSVADFQRIYERVVLLEPDPIARINARDTLARHARDSPTLATSDPANRIPDTIAAALDRSARLDEDWSPAKVAEGLRVMEGYAWNLVDYPWKKEFHFISTFSGFFKTHVELNFGVTVYLHLFALLGYAHHSETGYLRLASLPPNRTNVVGAAFGFFRASVELEAQHSILETVGFAGITASAVYRCRLSFSGDANSCAELLLKRSSSGAVRGIPRQEFQALEANTEAAAVRLGDVALEEEKPLLEAILYGYGQGVIGSGAQSARKGDASKDAAVSRFQRGDDLWKSLSDPVEDHFNTSNQSSSLRAPLFPPGRGCGSDAIGRREQPVHSPDVFVDSAEEHIARDALFSFEAELQRELSDVERTGCRLGDVDRSLMARGIQDEREMRAGETTEGMFRRPADAVAGRATAPLVQQTGRGVDENAPSKEINILRNLQSVGLSEASLKDLHTGGQSALRNQQQTMGSVIPTEVVLHGKTNRVLQDQPAAALRGFTRAELYEKPSAAPHGISGAEFYEKSGKKLTERFSAEPSGTSDTKPPLGANYTQKLPEKPGTELRGGKSSANSPGGSGTELPVRSYTEPIGSSPRNTRREQQIPRAPIVSHSEPIYVPGTITNESTRLDPAGFNDRPVERNTRDRPVERNTRDRPVEGEMAATRQSGERSGLESPQRRADGVKGEPRSTGGRTDEGGRQKRSEGMGRADAEGEKQRGRGGERGVGEKKIWQCRMCTFANDVSRDACEMCMTSRFE